QGVTIFRVADGEHVVSAARIEEAEEEAEADLRDPSADGQTGTATADATIGEDLSDGGESAPDAGGEQG
ncbi:hypothetical protein, partial [Escherichia coli]|uniref:hypothetical protein n=1 Tax=Escherichia coli TaxID=562 RepID=UPI00307A24AC